MVLSNEQSLLLRHNHLVESLMVSNDDVQGFATKMLVAWQATYAPRGYAITKKALSRTQPDLVHVHNFFPLLSPSICNACQEAGIPLVMTLHNYRLICPGALLMRDGKICEKCVTGSPYQSVLHRCYRNSIPGSWAVARMVAYHRKKQTWQHKVDRFITLTQFGKQKFVEAGFPEEKIVVKPNFYDISGSRCKEKGGSRSGVLFVGRLSKEKGVATMLEAWQTLDILLRVAGDGPLLGQQHWRHKANITFLGQLPAEQVSTEMSQASFLAMPSECYEGFPLVLVEAFAHSLPVLASRLGGMAEIVEDGVTGLHFEPGNPHDLAQKVQWLQDHPEECRKMGENARQEYEEKYTPEKNYEMLMDVYRQAIENHRAEEYDSK